MKQLIMLLVMILTIAWTIPSISISESSIIDIESPTKEASTVAKPKAEPEAEIKAEADTEPLPSNNVLPEETAGNTTNKGLAIEDETAIYYSDGLDLWSMNKNTKIETRLITAVYPVNLQLLEDKVYYINEENHHIFSVNKDGTEISQISDDKAYSINIYNRRIYFMDRYNNLYITSMSLDGKDKQVIKEIVANDMMIYNDYIFYITRGGNIGEIRIDGARDKILKTGVIQFDVAKTGIYYTYDPRVGYNPKGLYHISFDDQEETQLLMETPYSFNVHGSKIYYNHPSKLSLYSMLLDGTQKVEVTGVNSTQINIAGNYIFYKNLEDSKKTYRIELDGTNRTALIDKTLVSNVMDLSREVNALEGKAMTPKLERTYNRAKDIVAEIIELNMSDYEKAKIIHDYVIKTSKYDVEAAENFLAGKESDGNAFTAYGILINQKGVCQGYAEAVQILLSVAGVESELVIGDAMDDEGTYIPHMWNLVLINDEYYMLDATWDDPVGPRDILLHDYFLVDSETLKVTHRWAYDEYPFTGAKD